MTGGDHSAQQPTVGAVACVSRWPNARRGRVQQLAQQRPKAGEPARATVFAKEGLCSLEIKRRSEVLFI